jgi:hypothetical protein
MSGSNAKLLMVGNGCKAVGCGIFGWKRPVEGRPRVAQAPCYYSSSPSSFYITCFPFPLDVLRVLDVLDTLDTRRSPPPQCPPHGPAHRRRPHPDPHPARAPHDLPAGPPGKGPLLLVVSNVQLTFSPLHSSMPSPPSRRHPSLRPPGPPRSPSRTGRARRP